MATLGIASLFLFAGLEVDLSEIRKNALRLSGHLAVRSLVLALSSWLIMRYLHLDWQSAALVSLALFTPSTGFILDSLPQSGLTESEQSEVTLNAIAGEILALVLLFFVSQAGSTQTLLVSGGALVLLIALTPFVFLLLGRFVVPYAPGSEFSLLLMVGLICSVITKALGVYYLVGRICRGLGGRLAPGAYGIAGIERRICTPSGCSRRSSSRSTSSAADSAFRPGAWFSSRCCMDSPWRLLRCRSARSVYGCRRGSLWAGNSAAAFGLPWR